MKRMRGLYLIIYVGILMACIAACTEVELVDDTKRSKSSLFRPEFNWQGAEADKPQHVQMLAVRNVRSWRAHGIADTDAPQSPWFGLSEPIIEDESYENGTGEGEGAQPGGGRNGSDTGGDNTDTDTGTDTGQEEIDPNARYRFRLRGGQYFVLATNYALEGSTVELRSIPDDLEETSGEGTGTDDPEHLIHYLNDNRRRTNDLQLCIRALDGRPDIVEDKDLPDFNPKFKYLAECQRIFYGLNPDVKVVAGTDTHATIDMNSVSQEVQVRFTVVMDGRVKLEGIPVVELSGICGRINLLRGFIDTTSIYRSAVEAELQEQQEASKTYTYLARFHTLGVLPAIDREHLIGPGILQVAVKVVPDGTDPNQKETGRYVYAGINPYTELTEAQVIVEGDDGLPRLRDNQEPILVDVTQPLVITEKYLVNAGQGLGWKQQKPTDIDVDI